MASKHLVLIIVAGIAGLAGLAILFYPSPGEAPISVLALAKDEVKLKPVLANMGITSAMEKLVEESGGGAIVDCHQEAHHIGRVGYGLFKEEAFRACNASCHSGCYHGAMEIFLKEKGTTNLASNIDSVCKLFETTFGNFECLHGVGHGVLAYLDYDVPESLNQCRELSTSFAQSSCYGGVFMENILTGQGLGAGTDVHATSWVNQTDPLYPCNKIDQSFDVQFQCYQMQTSWMLTLFNYDFDKVVKECVKTPKEMVPVCFKSFGRDVAGNTLRNPEKIMAHCAKVPNKYREQCLVGALNVIVDFWGPSLTNQASALCNLTSGEEKQMCYATLASRLQDLFKTKEERRVVCDTFESKYQNLCG